MPNPLQPHQIRHMTRSHAILFFRHTILSHSAEQMEGCRSCILCVVQAALQIPTCPYMALNGPGLCPPAVYSHTYYQLTSICVAAAHPTSGDGIHAAIHMCKSPAMLRLLLTTTTLHVDTRSTEGQTLLHMCSAHGDTATAAEAIALGASVNAVDNKKYNALHHACRHVRHLSLACNASPCTVDASLD